MLPIRDSEERFQTSQDAVASPVFRQLYRGAREIARILLELLLEFLEQGKCVGGRASESSEQLAPAERADFLGVGLHHGLSDGDLPVATERDLPVATHSENSRGAYALELTFHRFKITGAG